MPSASPTSIRRLKVVGVAVSPIALLCSVGSDGRLETLTLAESRAAIGSGKNEITRYSGLMAGSRNSSFRSVFFMHKQPRE